MKSGTLTKSASAQLDMIRGLAAVAVLIGHVRGLFFVDFGALETPSVFLRAMYAVTGLGHQAVMVFFVLSGFLVGGSVLKTVRTWSWRQYLVHRLTRLYIVLLPALFLTACADFVGWRLPSAPAYYAGIIPHFNSAAYRLHLSWTAFAGNAVFLQTIAVPTFGSDDPLWSLANEFWYYLLFPALVLAFTKKGHLSRFAYGGMTFALSILLPIGMVSGFAIWLFGVFIWASPTITLSRRFRQVVITLFALAFGIILALARVSAFSDNVGDVVVGVAFALWLYSMVRTGGPAHALKAYHTVGRLISGCSYSVYAVDFPFVLLARAWLPETLGRLESQLSLAAWLSPSVHCSSAMCFPSLQNSTLSRYECG